MTDIIGQTIAERYQFVERLGEGTFAQVYRVHDTRRNVDLAAKVLRVDIAHEPTFLERFRREGDVLARLQHPHIVRYYDLIETDEATFILMDYIPGETLQSTLYKLGRPLLVREAFEFLKPLTAALHFAHGEGVIHRDLKPGNILINENGNLFVTDFGIARLLDDATFISSLGQALGTPLYMAPEQITNDEISPATDVYSLGIILYQMLTATVPFSGKHPSATGATTSERITYEHLYVPPPPLQMFSENLPQAVDEVVICCLAKKPFARPASVREVYDMLAEAIGAAPSDLSPLPARSGDPPEEARLPEVSQFVNFRASMAEGDHPEATPEPEDDTPAEVTLPGTGELRAAAGNSSAQQVAVDDRPTHSKNPFRAKTIESSKPENQRTLTSRGSPRPATSEALPSPAESLPSASRQSIHGRRDVVILLLLGIIAMSLACIVLGAFILSSAEDDDSGDDGQLQELVGSNIPTVTDVMVDNATTGSDPVAATPRGITPPPVDETASPTASPSPAIELVSKLIVYSSHRSGKLNIFVTHVDGVSQRQQLTTNAELNQTGPEWSPDGSRIAFYAYRETGGNADIYVMNADGTGINNLTNTPDADDRYVSWSPDGAKLIFHSNRNSQDSTIYRLYIYDFEDESLTPVTEEGINELGADWSPDGRRVAFHSYVDGGWRIVTSDLDGGNRRQISPSDLGDAFFPTWSPNGDQLAFHVRETGTGERDAYQVYIVNLDGTGLRPLLPVSINDRFPSWSPDGEAIVFQREQDGIEGIYWYSFAEEIERPVGNALGDFLPDWHP